MELGSIVEFLQDKTILVTGATGFLAKIFAEKVLRVQPNVKKLYLLLRAPDSKSATQRFQNEISGKELFKVLKEKCGEKYSCLISEKVVPLAGDISLEDLGVNDSQLKQQMLSQVDAIINLAATTKFDERYDVALNINTIGAKNVVEFAKRCSKLKVLVHVSTAYVCGERGGLIEERPFNIGDTLNGAAGLDIDAEIKLVHQRLHQLNAAGTTPEATSVAMKELGLTRAKAYGWPNTYVFTKSMGEMLVGQLKDNIPTVILRPTIVSSTYKEPFPGWVEGIRTIDSLIVAYGKGKLNCFMYDPNGIIDVVPADMVVNSIIASMAAHSGDHQCLEIYNVGSSMRNPLVYSQVKDYCYLYFKQHPWINKEGNPVIVGGPITVLSTTDSFQRYMALRYLLPLKGLELANAAMCQYFRGNYLELSRKIRTVMRLADLYRPYVFFKGIFDDINTEKLRMAAMEKSGEGDIFYFDPKIINWDDYFLNIHIPGVVKHVFK